MSLLGNDIGIDLGTSHIRIYVKGKGLVVEEPSVAIIRNDGPRRKLKLVSIGNSALQRVNSLAVNEQLVRPIEFGIVQDNELMVQILHALIIYAAGGTRLVKPRLFVTYPCDTSDNNKIILRTLCNSISSRQVFLISKPIASAYGIGLKVNDSKANLIIDIGAGTADIAVIALGGVANSYSLDFAGNLINREIIKQLSPNAKIEFEQAEQLKIELGTARPSKINKNYPVQTSNGFVQIYESEITPVIDMFKESLRRAIIEVLKSMPLAMIPDVMEKGIFLTGGVSNMPGLADYLSAEFNINVNVSIDPDHSAITGLGNIINSLDDIERMGRSTFLEAN